ncbi:universal stress protein [Pelagibacterium lacus]|uniref:Universal stress protein n=1 Tax=Pelagibacterium lacus TaxID=2282655 RepID=A0A369W5B4_9HYPH|nr:universal stress protein [Pelagibacterium lacus]RDE09197.1 universal stress protein [Pelagibacterium lacus]
MYKHILIATDGSELAQKGLDHGLALAKSLGAAVTVVTVTANELMSYREIAEEVNRGHNPFETFRAAMEKEANRILESASEKARTAGVTIRTEHVAERPPAEGIIEAATENQADLIIMSSHGRRGIQRLMLGSQTAEVVATSKIPVLVIR